MSEKPKLSLFQILSRIVLGLLSLICLLGSIYYVYRSIDSYKPFYGAVVIFLVLALLFAPVYARLFRSLSTSYGEGVSKAAPFIRGGLFVLRLFALFILALFFISQWNQIKSDLRSMIPARISTEEMAELVDYIRNDQRSELSYAIYNLQSQQKKIDYNLLIAENFRVALNQAKNDPNSSTYVYGSEVLEQRLFLDIFSTRDSIFSRLPDYESSDLAAYIPPHEMFDLFMEYGKFSLGYEKFFEANLYFRAAVTLDPDNPDVILSVADIYLGMNFLNEAAENYEYYCSLMKDEGKENKIPKRVTKFLEAGMYGEKLQKNLFECWLNDQTNDPYFSLEYYESNNMDYVYIGERIYGQFYGFPDYLLFGPKYYYWEGDSLNFGLAGCVTKLLGGEPQKMNVHAITELCGMDFYSDMDLPFTHINPEIINWARKNLIPDPGLLLFDKPCQRIYNVMFRNVLRKKALGYAFLHSLYSVDEQAGDYQYHMYDEHFDGVDYLWSYYYDNASYFQRTDIDPWTLAMETGFWLRRYMDGTYNECWNLLSLIMNQYDQSWFDYVWEGWERMQEYPDEDYQGGEGV